MSRHLLARGAVGTLAALLLVTGCTSPVPVPSPDPKPSAPQPALVDGQDQHALDAIGATITEADTAKDAALLAPRVEGPALAMRTAQITLAAALGQDNLLTAIPTEVAQMIVPTTTDWPRALYAVTVQPEDKTTNRLLALTQDTSRDTYKLWGWVPLFPGTTLPAFAMAKVGSPEIAPDDTSLAITPADAIGQYADLLTQGDASAFAAAFAPDSFRTLVASETARLIQEMAGAKGTYSINYAVDPGQPIYSVGTYDGGAVVMGVLNGSESRIAEEGGSVAAGPRRQAFLGDTPDSNVLNCTYILVVALYIPPAGSTDPVQALGAEQQLTGATR